MKFLVNCTLSNLEIAQVMKEQAEYRPDILREKYPKDLKGALGIKVPKGNILSFADRNKILNMFPHRHNILDPVKVLVFRKRDLINEIIRGNIDIRDVNSLEDKIRQRILALFLKKEISINKHGRDPFLIRCANKYRNALKKIDFLRKVESFTLEVDDIIGMSGYKGHNKFKILNKYNQLLKKKGMEHKTLKIPTTPEEKEKIVRRLKILRSNYLDDFDDIRHRSINFDKARCNASYFDSVSVLIEQILERNIIKYSSTKKECENFLKFHKTISSTTHIYYQDDINRVNIALDCLIRELSV